MNEVLQIALVGFLGVAALLATISMLASRWDSTHAPMILGVSLVSILALVAASEWVFGIAVVMVAAPIAGPAFAQNIAAIFMNREWAIVDSGREVRPPIATSEQPTVGPGTTAALRQLASSSAWEFESSGISALAASSDYADAEIRSDVVLRGPAGKAAQIDAVALRPDGSAELFEFKRSVDPGRLRRDIEELDNWRQAYQTISSAPNVSATLVIPTDYPRIRQSRPWVRIARFDQGSGSINWDEPLD